MRGAVVRVDHHDGVLDVHPCAAQFLGQRRDATEWHRFALYQVLSADADHDVDLVGPLELLLGVSRRQADLQFGELGIGGREHEENDDHEQYVDHRDQVDLGIFLRAPAEVHKGRQPFRACGPP